MTLLLNALSEHFTFVQRPKQVGDPNARFKAPILGALGAKPKRFNSLFASYKRLSSPIAWRT